jgi:hypothetical protein
VKGKLLSIFLVVAVVVSLCLVTVVPVAANDTWDVTITAESNGNPLYDVLINYSYNGSAGYDTTPLTLSDVPNNTELKGL